MGVPEFCHQINFDGNELFARPDILSYLPNHNNFSQIFYLYIFCSSSSFLLYIVDTWSRQKRRRKNYILLTMYQGWWGWVGPPLKIWIFFYGLFHTLKTKQNQTLLTLEVDRKKLHLELICCYDFSEKYKVIFGFLLY